MEVCLVQQAGWEGSTHSTYAGGEGEAAEEGGGGVHVRARRWRGRGKAGETDGLYPRLYLSICKYFGMLFGSEWPSVIVVIICNCFGGVTRNSPACGH